MFIHINRLLLTVGTAAAVAGAVTFFSSKAEAAVDSTQNYTPARFALLAAELNVSSMSIGPNNTRQVIVRADTATGQCWVLELTVPGEGSFQVIRADWKAIPVNLPNQ